MLRLSGGQVESLFDEALPVEVRELPGDLATLDSLLSDPAVLEPVERAWDVAAREICRQVISGAVRERRFCPRAARIDSTVVEADIRYPSDLGLAADAPGTLAREGRKAAALAREDAPRVRDRSRATNRRLRTLNRTLARRTGQGKETALRLTGQAGELVARSVRETRRLARRLRDRARGRGAQAKLRAAQRLEELADRADKVARQIRQRLAGEKITDRLVSMADPDARPIRKGKLRQPTEFGYVVQITEITENTRRGARGLILPPPSQIGSPNEADLLPATGAELDRLGITPREVALDGGFAPGPVDQHLPARANVHRRPPERGVQTHRPAPGALPRRRRRPHQPPQTRLRPAQKPP